MSDIRFNQWLHNSGTGGVSQVDGGHVGIGTTNPLIPVGAGVTAILNVGVVTANYYYGDGSNLSGVQVGGASSLSFNDNIGVYFGNSQDLKIHHDGNHSYIDDQGTGNLRLRSGTLEILNLAGNKTSATFSSGGGQTLNFNNNTKFVTTNTGVNVTGIVTASSTVDVKGTTSIGTDALQLSFSAPEGHIKTKNTTGSPASNLALHTTDTSGNTNRVMHLRYDGYVGIGTNIPGSLLTLDHATNPSIQFKDSGTKVASINAEGTQTNIASFESKDIVFACSTSSSFTERLRIRTDGNVDINGTPPWSVSGGNYRNLSISGEGQSASGFLWLGNGAQTANADFDLGRINFCNGPTIVARVLATTQTSNIDDGRISIYTKQSGQSEGERLRIYADGQVTLGNPTNTTLKAEINNSVGGHYFVSQCDDNQNGFEIYQQHGATNTRAPFAVYDNKTGSKDLSFKIDGAGWTYHNTAYNNTTNGNVDKRYNFGSTNNSNMAFHLTTRQRYSIWEHRQIGRTHQRTAQMSCGENGFNQGTVIMYSSTANADVTGGVNLTNGATSWSGNSDMRLKNKTGDILNALEDINKIEPLKFTWKYGPDNNPHVGVSAQSVENVVPEAIERGVDVERQREGDETEYMQVRYTELIPLSIAAIKELKSEVESLKAEIASLKSS